MTPQFRDALSLVRYSQINEQAAFATAEISKRTNKRTFAKAELRKRTNERTFANANLSKRTEANERQQQRTVVHMAHAQGTQAHKCVVRRRRGFPATGFPGTALHPRKLNVPRKAASYLRHYGPGEGGCAAGEAAGGEAAGGTAGATAAAGEKNASKRWFG